ncbi:MULTISPECIES: hypothetical protein [Rhodanobacter]|uniref:hypothetical protein n=1 Tax=Rhodanobacter TaxID=75309 RepID=UPI00122B151D|nr:hypothetical protein [Rhodanobacter thiooxydans]TAN14693.1 MAG: hypothetical protein EPN35_15395 [Rhodanobacter sp.]UJJ55311.1 hypothetical protein LRK53_02590 [Rhodanobacter thiooxydans]
MAEHETVTQVTVSCERVWACTGLAIEENHRMWFSSQALSGCVPAGSMHRGRERLAVPGHDRG